MPNPRNRVNEKGQYCPVPGTTVISMIQESDTHFWKTVYNRLKDSPTLCQYYTPLPHTSYHMTGFSLDIIDDIPENEDWTAFIDKKIPFYSRLHETLSVSNLRPQIKFGVLNATRIIVLEVCLSPEQKNALEELAKECHCENNMPWLFHITLAYQHNKDLTNEAYDKITAELKSLSRIFEEKNTITLAPLELCYFEDMTRFVPWNGATNPFTAPLPFSSNLYGFYNTIKEMLFPTEVHASSENALANK